MHELLPKTNAPLRIKILTYRSEHIIPERLSISLTILSGSALVFAVSIVIYGPNL